MKSLLIYFSVLFICTPSSLAQFNFNAWTTGATSGTINNGSCQMAVSVTGSLFQNSAPRYDDAGVTYSPTSGTGLALDHNWANLSTTTVVTMTFSPAIANPSFTLYDINRNGSCIAFCSSSWSDRVTVQSNAGTLTATPAVPAEQTVTNVNATTKTITGNLVCNGTNGNVAISVSGVVSTITVTYTSGPTVDRTTASSPNTCGALGGPANCNANRSACTDPARQYITIGSVSTTSCTTLPVEFGDFYDQCQDNQNKLKWYTLSEVNNDKFQVFESEDGANFNLIHEQAGAGNTQELRSYEFLDYDRMYANKYYKLSQVDLDGKTTDLKTIFIPNDCMTNTNQYLIFPNPSISELNILNNKSHLESTTQITVRNLEGKIVYSNLLNDTFESIQIDTQDWSRGFYFVQIENDQNIEIKKIEKI